MSSLWLNWRFWYWHLQIGPDWPFCSVGFNRAHWDRGVGWRWFERY